MTTTTTTTTATNKDDIMTLSSYAAIINETLPHNPELQLSIHDLVHPTESAESLLETLSNEQLSIIEQAVSKIKERKMGSISNDAANENHQVQQSTSSTTTDSNSTQEAWNTHLVANVLAEAISNQENLSNAQQLPQTESIESNTLPLTIANKTSKDKPPTPPPQRNEATSHPNPKATTAKPPVTSNAAPSTSPFLSSHEPTTELKEGIEWVSFVYSHHRTLRRYCIRTDLDKVDTSILDDKFKKENCVYPRANLPRETYRGNRWSYETECNVLGWKLAYLNLEEIAGKRGLIQRAVDSYRNRYPSMRSRRVARQEKLLKGTLRKRKHRETTGSTEDDEHSNKASKNQHEYSEKAPKTILIEDSSSTSKCRIRINIESVLLDAVDIAFRKNNCVFPRAMHITSETPSVSQRRLDEAKCNEIGWKLAWLNPRQLANKKNLLQKALDTYRNQFTPNLRPRKYASRIAPAPYVPPPPPPPPTASNTAASSPPSATTQATEIPQEEAILKQESNTDASANNNKQTTPLTAQALADQQRELQELGLASAISSPHKRRDSTTGQSCYSGTTVTLDFHDFCFSPPPEEDNDMMASCEEDTTTTTTMHDVSTAANSPIFPATTNMFEDFILASFQPVDSSKDILMPDQLLSNGNNSSDESNGSSYQNTPSPQALITLSELYQQAFLMGAATSDGTTDGLFHPDNTKDTSLFMLDDENANHVGGNVIDLIAKYGNVNAGVDDFTNASSSVADSSLLNQLF
ncbi:hypothetical protein MUCCIDRAFT_164008 [Mucor lusitanicus CBS 277.49]|uniref:DUF8032 domain-containing protein n=2 Tax=Mucor circinelloides f. lusitanicus TaxID=29924 RepID=A0A168K784_MUCCL|nr:hypothetical protein MUCCIDRAFT_164008 [Mucor lusitanicus CBS 277.49]